LVTAHLHPLQILFFTREGYRPPTRPLSKYCSLRGSTVVTLGSI